MQEHPIEFVDSFLATCADVCAVQFSVYRYHPESLWDDRKSYAVSPGELRSKYAQLAKQLEDNEDIAFDSVVKDGRGRKRHFGLVDFNTPDRVRAEQASDLLVSEYEVPRAALVFSGRSYHLYMGMLLSHPSWVKFMGRILLLNPRNEPPIIDSRWVGHRLVGGCASLRWSARGRPNLPVVLRAW
jgi:hypothetical protein